MANFSIFPASAEPNEHLPAETELPGVENITVVEIDTAAEKITNYVHARLDACLKAFPGRPAILLSGGIDSQLVLADLAEKDPVAVTFSGTEKSEDEAAAAALAEKFGVEHRIVSPGTDAFDTSVSEAAKVLDSADPWEIAAAIPVTACVNAVADLGGAIFTGGGADLIFGGGQKAPENLTAYIRRRNADLRRGFITPYPIPDFHQRILGPSAERYIDVFKTVQALTLACTLHPQVLWAAHDGREIDKAAVRKAGITAGVPAELAYRPKSPLQASSGTFSALLGGARRYAATFEESGNYTDALSEPIDLLAIRLWLALLARDRT